MAIRQARAGDAAALAAVRIASWQTAYRQLLPPARLSSLDINRETAKWLAQLAVADWTTLVAVAGEVVGYVVFGPSRDPDLASSAEVAAMYVHPDNWRRGIGRHLLTAATGAMADRGYEDAALWVLAENWRGRGFYESQGWECDLDAPTETEDGASKVRYRTTGLSALR